jgi:exodeoxyribonuclease III
VTALTVSTVNVNGIRAAARKGLLDWLRVTDADVVCVQECRALPEEFPELPAGWQSYYAPSGGPKGRNGVGVLVRAAAGSSTGPAAVRVGFGSTEFDGSGRYLEIDLPGLGGSGGVTIASLYLPNGTVGTPKQDEKDRFLAEFAPYLAERREKAAAEDREVLVCGDWNIAHTRADIRVPAARAGLDRRGVRRRVRRRGARAAPRGGRAVLVVVLPGPGVRQRHRLAHRLPGGHCWPGAARGGGPGRTGRRARAALVRPRPGHRPLPVTGESLDSAG